MQYLPAPIAVSASAPTQPAKRGQDTSLLAEAAPQVAPVSEAALQLLADFLLDYAPVAVITGAGVSTESNLPDYRGPNGAYKAGHKPMTH